MIRKNIYITQAQEDFLANLEGLAISEHIRRAIDEYIDRKQKSLLLSPSKHSAEYDGWKERYQKLSKRLKAL